MSKPPTRGEAERDLKVAININDAVMERYLRWGLLALDVVEAAEAFRDADIGQWYKCGPDVDKALRRFREGTE